MDITVTQPQKEYASRNVRILVDHNVVAVIQPGDSLLIHVSTPTCVIGTECNSFRCSRKVTRSGKLMLCWNPRLEKMELIPT